MRGYQFAVGPLRACLDKLLLVAGMIPIDPSDCSPTNFTRINKVGDVDLALLARVGSRTGFDNMARIHGRSIFGQIFERSMNL